VQFFFRHSNCYGIRSLTTPSPSPFLLLLLLFCSCVQSTFTLCNIPIPSRFICLIRTNCFRAQIRNGSGSGAILIKSNTILFHGSHGLLPQLRSLFRRWWLKFATFSPCELHNLRNSGGRQGRLCATSLHRTGVRLTFDYPKKITFPPDPAAQKCVSSTGDLETSHVCQSKRQHVRSDLPLWPPNSQRPPSSLDNCSRVRPHSPPDPRPIRREANQVIREMIFRKLCDVNRFLARACLGSYQLLSC
jgi:hypothetical protein